MSGSGSTRGLQVAALLVAAAVVLGTAPGLVLGQQSSPKKADPTVLIGPTRVTLTGGKTIEGIAVFREASRVRVVLEDGTEIALDPSKVVSIVALADLPDEPPPAARPAAKAAAPARKGARTPVKVHGEPAGNGATTSARKGAGAKAEPEDAPAGAGVGAGGADAATAKAKQEREREIEELAGMLQAAIANAALEGPGTGGPDSATDEQGDAAKDSGKGTTLAPPPPPPPSEQSDASKKPYKPKPEDFDATRPVNKAGYRFLGPKGKLPETPPQTDFPKPSTPATNLGFEADKWRPKSGFSSTAKWGAPLAPATSFPNRLSGLDRPITSFGPRWWAPKSTTWSSSIFPESWQPKDAFAKDQERKDASKAPAESPPASQNK